ncbi:MAG: hypothetical protein OXU67_05020 [Chloroflexota bacterium]|nr:hypothetical protein [Chloroflexota bacterium]
MSRNRILGERPLAKTGVARAKASAPSMIGFGTGRMLLLFAYVDPGSAGFIITTVLGVLAAGGYIARSYLNRLKQWVFRRNRGVRRKDVSSSADDQADDR